MIPELQLACPIQLYQVVLSTNFLAHCSESEQIDGGICARAGAREQQIILQYQKKKANQPAVSTTWTWVAWVWNFGPSGCCFVARARNLKGPTTMAQPRAASGALEREFFIHNTICTTG
jgi:hypothetical protein